MRRLTSVLLAPLLAGAVLALGGCSHETTISYKDTTATVQRGDALVIDFGKVNGSIGDSWYIVQDGDGRVLAAGERQYTSDCQGNVAGCGGSLKYEFAARKAGEAELVFQYCYRSGPDNCQPMPDRGPVDPVRVHVIVRT
ncbi:protease inhibitor I42 family protein [Hamadaea tsunoensis]|uniref:protease inhibitor I42 family protein n=1 Tax=Hamadaea tsunoensis TaxID=53368 RepID=UPI0003F59AC8|nr:protease inhibitor I42 family protein [Hamadaea tsunoensis]